MADEPPRPTTDDADAWRAYWQARDQPWRTQPEIPAARQTYLAERRAIEPDLVAGVYPFHGVALTRADIEWLLATHDSGLGFIGPIPRKMDRPGDLRRGLDVRGAIMDDVDLSGLPLTELIANLLLSEKNVIMDAVASREAADGPMERAVTHFERASFRGAYLESAFLVECEMQSADFTDAHMTGVAMYGGRLKGATFAGAKMQGASMQEIRGEDTDFHDALLDGAVFSFSNLRRANFTNASLIPLDPFPERLRERGLTPEAMLDYCHLEGANFTNALMYKVDLRGAYLEGADLTGAHLDGANMDKAHLTAETVEPAIIAPPPPDPIQDEWKTKGQPWRTQPEIDAARQTELAELRVSQVDEANRRFPFTGVELTRADVEWLLATHDDGRGPVDWDDPAQRDRQGIDVRGADLHGVDLQGLPLARTRAGVRRAPSLDAPFSSEVVGLTNLNRANLAYAHLEGADLTGAQMEMATLEWARLDEANLTNARMENVKARFAHFERANLFNANIPGVLDGAHLEGVQARDARFIDAQFKAAHLEGADLTSARLHGADLTGATLDGAICQRAAFTNTDVEARSSFRKPAILTGASLVNVDLTQARLDGATMRDATLCGATLLGAHLDNADLTSANLAGADLRRAVFASQTRLDGVSFAESEHGPARLAGLVWGGADLAGVAWERLTTLGDELAARRRRDPDGRRFTREQRLIRYEEAVRANAQLAIALTQSGLNEAAAPFAYRAQVLQRQLLWRQIIWRGDVSRLGSYLLASLLGLLTGYGYRVGRIVVAYLIIVVACAIALFALGLQTGHPLAPQDAFLISLTAFHGRVFSGQFAPDSPQSWITAIEAICGLVVESVFIAMLTQRFFGK